MAQKATVRKLAREAEGQRTPDDALDDKRMALYLAQEWTDDVAHTCGFGWFRRGPGGLWVPDPNGVEVRNRIRRVLTGSKIARRGVRTRDVARELADELNVEVDAWNGGDVLGLPDGRVVDLRTGETRAATRDERVYQRLAVVPEPGRAERMAPGARRDLRGTGATGQGDCLRPMVVPVLARGLVR